MFKVGYIGLGLMGKSMARNILKAGYSLYIWNRTKSKCDELVADGAVLCTTPSEVASMSDVIFTNLSDSPDVWEVVFGKDGIYEGIRENSIFIDNSTIKASVSREIAERLWKEKKVYALDAPVSGGDLGAREGTLTIMVGGAAEALERALPLLQTIGKSITHIGDSGAGQICKAANQIMVAAQMVAMGEILIFSEKAGVESERVINAIKGGAAQCWTLDVKPQRLFAGNREPGFKASLQSKDLNIVMDSSREFGVPLPSAAIHAQMFQSMLSNNEGELDNSAVIGVIERMANKKLTEKSCKSIKKSSL